MIDPAYQDHCNTNYGPEDIPAPEVWEQCEDCQGEGYIEKPQPFHDDPYYCVSITCDACNGAGGFICEAT